MWCIVEVFTPGHWERNEFGEYWHDGAWKTISGPMYESDARVLVQNWRDAGKQVRWLPYACVGCGE